MLCASYSRYTKVWPRAVLAGSHRVLHTQKLALSFDCWCKSCSRYMETGLDNSVHNIFNEKRRASSFACWFTSLSRCTRTMCRGSKVSAAIRSTSTYRNDVAHATIWQECQNCVGVGALCRLNTAFPSTPPEPHTAESCLGNKTAK